MAYKKHKTVLKEIAVDHLYENVGETHDSLFADLTFGGGGHSLEILFRSNYSKVIALDQDPEANANAQTIISEKKLDERLFIEKINFKDIDMLISEKYKQIFSKYDGFSGIIADLGVSAHHFESNVRGFSFRSDSALDMRMDSDNSNIKTAREIINEGSKEQLEEIIREYGEERFTKKIVNNILIARKKGKINTTKELENIIFHSYPKAMRHGRTHPATRTFQAFRIAVNDELNSLSDLIPKAYSLLKNYGRLVIITFHSLEDRIVKNSFKNLNKDQGAKIVTKKPIVPSKDEIKGNSRARSAKLRVIEKAPI